jgi:hypothetical protein
VDDAKLRYVFSFQDMHMPTEYLRVARALGKDISTVVKAETPKEILERRKAEKKEAEEHKKRPLPLP